MNGSSKGSVFPWHHPQAALHNTKGKALLICSQSWKQWEAHPGQGEDEKHRMKVENKKNSEPPRKWKTEHTRAYTSTNNHGYTQTHAHTWTNTHDTNTHTACRC